MAQLNPLKQASQIKRKIQHSQETLPPEHRKMERQFIISLLLVTLFCLISIQFFDRPIAIFVSNLHHGSLSLSNFDFTTILTNVAYFLILFLMLTYFILRFFSIEGPYVEISGVLSLSMAIAFFIKTQFQLFFGRIVPRYGSFQQLNFVRKPDLYGFHLMQGGSFPSGHMVIFTCMFLILTFYYKKLETYCYTLLTILAFLLIYDNYHFLSDIIAGTYLGTLIALSIKFLLKIKPNN